MHRVNLGAKIPFSFWPAELSPDASAALDIIRALAAIAVMLGHLRGLFYVDYEHVAVLRAPVRALYFFTGFGHQAVMVFFVLSGLLISSSVFRNLSRGTWNWANYAIDRSVRLYVVLVPGLFLGALWDLLGNRFFNQTGIYSTPLTRFGDFVPVQQLSVANFLGCLLFVQTRFSAVLGSNGPLWSLFNEFWYYVLFPVLIGLILSVIDRSVLMLMYVAMAAFAVWILGGALSGFVVWLSGAALAFTPRVFRFADRWWTVVYTLCAATAVAACLFAARTHRAGPMGSDLFVGLSFAFLVHGIVQLKIPVGKGGQRIAKTFAGFSYSLYVLHFPMLLLIRAARRDGSYWQPDAIHLFWGGVISIGVLLYAFGIAEVTEKKTSAVRSWVRQQFGFRAGLKPV